RLPSGYTRSSTATRASALGSVRICTDVQFTTPCKSRRARGGFRGPPRRTSASSQVPEALAAVLLERRPQRGLVVACEPAVPVVAAAADVDGVAAGPIRADLLVRERALDDLVRAGRRDVAQEANVARPPLRADGLLGIEPVSEPGRVERRAVAQDDADHHLIARLVVRHSVHGSDDHVGVTRDRVLDWLSGEVLAVDAYPFGVATREVEVA